MSSTRRSILAMGVAGVVSAKLGVPAFGAPQDNVNSLIARIRATLNDSLTTAQWQAKYRLAGMNIEDLAKTLEYGGSVTSNPVAEFGDRLEAMLNERREMLAYLVSKQQLVIKIRKGQAKQTIQDVGVEMIRRITPKPGIFDALTAPGTYNERVIRDDFSRLRSIDDTGKKIDAYINDLRPAINDILARYNALNPLLIAYGKLGAKGFEGTYIGQFEGGGHGRIKLTIQGASVSGTISGSCTASPCGVDPMVGSFSGAITKDGAITTHLSGTLTDSSGRLGSFGFSGTLDGQASGNTITGTWTGKNAWGAPSGTWSASR